MPDRNNNITAASRKRKKQLAAMEERRLSFREKQLEKAKLRKEKDRDIRSLKREVLEMFKPDRLIKGVARKVDNQIRATTADAVDDALAKPTGSFSRKLARQEDKLRDIWGGVKDIRADTKWIKKTLKDIGKQLDDIDNNGGGGGLLPIPFRARGPRARVGPKGRTPGWTRKPPVVKTKSGQVTEAKGRSGPPSRGRIPKKLPPTNLEKKVGGTLGKLSRWAFRLLNVAATTYNMYLAWEEELSRSGNKARAAAAAGGAGAGTIEGVIIGSGIGFALAGPVGAFIGAIGGGIFGADEGEKAAIAIADMIQGKTHTLMFFDESDPWGHYSDAELTKYRLRKVWHGYGATQYEKLPGFSEMAKRAVEQLETVTPAIVRMNRTNTRGSNIPQKFKAPAKTSQFNRFRVVVNELTNPVRGLNPMLQTAAYQQPIGGFSNLPVTPKSKTGMPHLPGTFSGKLGSYVPVPSRPPSNLAGKKIPKPRLAPMLKSLAPQRYTRMSPDQRPIIYRSHGSPLIDTTARPQLSPSNRGGMPQEFLPLPDWAGQPRLSPFDRPKLPKPPVSFMDNPSKWTAERMKTFQKWWDKSVNPSLPITPPTQKPNGPGSKTVVDWSKIGKMGGGGALRPDLSPGTIPSNQISSLPANAKAQDYERTAFQFFKSKGYSDAEAAAVVGNLRIESGHWRVVNGYGDFDNQSYGIAQWRGARLQAMFNKYGPNPTFEQQLEFADSEARNGSHSVFNKKWGFGQGETDISRLSESWRRKFEVAVDTHAQHRINAANEVLTQSQNSTQTASLNVPKVSYQIQPKPSSEIPQAPEITASGGKIVSPIKSKSIVELASIKSKKGEREPGKRRGFLADRSHTGSGKPRLHAGIDIFGKPGEPARATEDGIVIRSQKQKGYNGTVDIQHLDKNGKPTHVTRYAHLETNLPLKVGDKVKAGDTVGQLDSDAHLHFETRTWEGYKKDPFARPKSEMTEQQIADLGLRDPSQYFTPAATQLAKAENQKSATITPKPTTATLTSDPITAIKEYFFPKKKVEALPHPQRKVVKPLPHPLSRTPNFSGKPEVKKHEDVTKALTEMAKDYIKSGKKKDPFAGSAVQGTKSDMLKASEDYSALAEMKPAKNRPKIRFRDRVAASPYQFPMTKNIVTASPYRPSPFDVSQGNRDLMDAIQLRREKKQPVSQATMDELSRLSRPAEALIPRNQESSVREQSLEPPMTPRKEPPLTHVSESSSVAPATVPLHGKYPPSARKAVNPHYEDEEATPSIASLPYMPF
jgi:murein DD-endopeptidase MepM/ murein hydrolase activator NlpD